MSYIFKNICEMLIMNYSCFSERRIAGGIQHRSEFYSVESVYACRAAAYMKSLLVTLVLYMISTKRFTWHHWQPTTPGHCLRHLWDAVISELVKVFPALYGFWKFAVVTRACIGSCSVLDASIAHRRTHLELVIIILFCLYLGF
jgi:hypothetical protein